MIEVCPMKIPGSVFFFFLGGGGGGGCGCPAEGDGGALFTFQLKQVLLKKIYSNYFLILLTLHIRNSLICFFSLTSLFFPLLLRS